MMSSRVAGSTEVKQPSRVNGVRLSHVLRPWVSGISLCPSQWWPRGQANSRRELTIRSLVPADHFKLFSPTYPWRLYWTPRTTADQYLNALSLFAKYPTLSLKNQSNCSWKASVILCRFYFLWVHCWCSYSEESECFTKSELNGGKCNSLLQ